MDLGLAGKKAVITGSTRGIGRAIANLLADEGVDLAICSRNQEEVDSAVADLSAKGVKVTGAVVDIADKEAYQGWVASAGEELGGIDIFIPNVSAGGGNMTEEGWQNALNIDMLGTTRGVEGFAGQFAQGAVGGHHHFEPVEGLEPGGHRERVPRQRARLVDRSVRGNLVHDLAFAAEGTNRHTATDDFTQCGQVRFDAKVALGTAESDAKPGHHLIKDQYDAVLATGLTNTFEETCNRWDAVHVTGNRLDDDTGNFQGFVR